MHSQDAPIHTLDARQRVASTIGVMMVVSGMVIALMTYLNYRQAVDRHTTHLQEVASSRARMIEAVGRYEASVPQREGDSTPLERTLAVVVRAHEAFPGLGRTGEFTLARREGDAIRFVLRHRHDERDMPPPVPMDGTLAEPMRQALLGYTGTLVGLDYRGETVLAAYEPVGVFDLGIVAKSDLTEVRAPVVQTAWMALALSAALMLLGGATAARVGSPLVWQVEQDAARLRAEVRQRRRAQAEHQLLSAAVEQISEAVMITDTAGVILYVNPAFETSTGYTREHALGQRPEHLGGLASTTALEDAFAAVREGERWHGQLQTHHRDGRARVEQVSVSPIIDAEGNPTHFVSVRADVTERRLLEEELQRAKRLEAVGSLAAGVAHDFNNILHAVLGHLETARGGPDHASSSLDDIEAAVRRAAELVRQLRNFSDADAPVPEPVSLRSVVEEVRALLLPTVPEGVAWVCPPADDPGIVLATRGGLHQVVLNLCTNAIQALGTTGSRLEIRVHSDDEAYVLLTIEDDGPGVPDELRERIFDPYFTTRRMGGGTGLGLALVHQTVRGLGGTVTLEAPPGGGSRFIVQLPRSHRPPATPAPIARAHQPVTLSAQRHVLLVDDDPLVLRATRRALVQAGFTTDAYAAADDALAAFLETPDRMDILVTDLSMPGMSGRELVRRVHAVRPGLPAIVISGRLDAQNLAELGKLDVLTLSKPLAMPNLCERMAELLARDEDRPPVA